MNKISVGETILHGYGFAVRRILANTGLSWLAAVFYAVAVGYWLHQFCTTMLVSPHPGSELNDFALFDLFCLVVVTALGSAIIARSLTGAALEPGGELMAAYLAVAKREWMLFLSLLRLYALVVIALGAVIFAGSWAIAAALPMIGAGAQWQGISALAAMNATIAVIAFVLTALLMVRLGFFAAPVASAERSSSAARAWSLSGGNAWRIFAVIAALSLPPLLFWLAVEWTLIGNDLTGALATALSTSHNSTAFYQLIDDNASVLAGTWTLLLVVLTMLFAGASAPAYLTVRDNVTARKTRSVQHSPVLEPAFAGSFAGFAPRDAKEPATGDIRVAPSVETFTAVAAGTPIAEALSEEQSDGDASTPLITQDEHLVAAPTPVEDTHDALEPAAAEESTAHVHAAENVETVPSEPDAEMHEIIPLPSHGDETESSQQNAPSEAA